jgi:NAD(P)H-quinone oxidoreductase subunit 4L
MFYLKLLMDKITMLQNSLLIAAFLFCIGIYGLVTSRSMVKALMCLELMLNGVNLNLVTFASYLDNQQIKGQVFVVFIIAIAAAEAAIGLSIILNIYRNRNSTRIDQFNLLKW